MSALGEATHSQIVCFSNPDAINRLLDENEKVSAPRFFSQVKSSSRLRYSIHGCYPKWKSRKYWEEWYCSNTVMTLNKLLLQPFTCLLYPKSPCGYCNAVVPILQTTTIVLNYEYSSLIHWLGYWMYTLYGYLSLLNVTWDSVRFFLW